MLKAQPDTLVLLSMLLRCNSEEFERIELVLAQTLALRLIPMGALVISQVNIDLLRNDVDDPSNPVEGTSVGTKDPNKVGRASKSKNDCHASDNTADIPIPSIEPVPNEVS